MRTIWLAALATLYLGASARADVLPNLLVGNWNVAGGKNSYVIHAAGETGLPDSLPNATPGESNFIPAYPSYLTTWQGKRVGRNITFKSDIFVAHGLNVSGRPAAGSLRAAEVLTFRPDGVFIRTIVFPLSPKHSYYAEGKWTYRLGKLMASYERPFQISSNGVEDYKLKATITGSTVKGICQIEYNSFRALPATSSSDLQWGLEFTDTSTLAYHLVRAAK